MDGRAPDDGGASAVERTMLAWNRTGLAALAAGVFVLRFLSSTGVAALRPLLGGLLVAVGVLCQVLAWSRGRHLAGGDPAPLSPAVARAVSLAVAASAAVALLAIVTRP